LGSERADGRRVVRGLRDPLATAPEALLPGTGLDTTDVRAVWEPYVSLDPAILARRAAGVLDAPATVRLRVEGTTLVASGTAPPDWLERSRARAPTLSGITRFDDTAITGRLVEALADSLRRAAVRFPVGSARLLPGQEPALDRLARLMTDLLATAAQADRAVRIQVLGHVSREGGDAFNQALSQQRAEATVRLLTARGLPSEAFEAVGTGEPRSGGSASGDAAQAFNRSAGFRVTYDDSPP
ncbi:MAG: OmpA family protein, partial [Rubricoccaceae bacterium]|nr:OmpA family protein [Rubricoccaceae bacterium]